MVASDSAVRLYRTTAVYDDRSTDRTIIRCTLLCNHSYRSGDPLLVRLRVSVIERSFNIWQFSVLCLFNETPLISSMHSHSGWTINRIHHAGSPDRIKKCALTSTLCCLSFAQCVAQISVQDGSSGKQLVYHTRRDEHCDHGHAPNSGMVIP